ncbi:LysR family transcriptional regulator [Micromonospora foliorum]|uniref:LysR substrate-binding domain-containing protein n=1 Tax=Micromonospora foliorum TaxID=2911210 RepID=UPI001EE89632|nr:LysR family transcriptional regulator [Micromonospora foliorum]MCG5435231.1 LysR family transcriptional regulator [Micromonospora foliorum]
MELRDIEIFLTLAEELHFGRTADRLRLTTARVSQSIKKQERIIGAPLFDRTTRAVALTQLGDRYRHNLSAGYRQITEAIQDAVAHGGGIAGPLTLGGMGPQTLAVSRIIEVFQARHPAVEIHYREIQPTAPFQQLRSGQVDIALLWLPVREPDLTVGPVTHVSQAMLMIGASHQLAGRTSVAIEDLGDCTVLTSAEELPAYMEEAINPFHTPTGRPIRRGPRVSSWHEELSVVATGKAVTIVAAEAAHFYPWPNITYLPIEDGRLIQWAPVWRTATETEHIRAFRRAAQKVESLDRGCLANGTSLVNPPVAERSPHL